jgi:hypothetical protein
MGVSKEQKNVEGKVLILKIFIFFKMKKMLFNRHIIEFEVVKKKVYIVYRNTWGGVRHN